MNLPFDCDDPRDADIVWRRPGVGSFYFIDSKAPEGYRVRGVNTEGQICFLGAYFQSVAFVDHPPTLSPLYMSPEEAKAACEYHRRFRVFPASESVLTHDMSKSAEEERLEAAGWKETTVAEFLELTPEEEAIVEEHLAERRQQDEEQKPASL